MTWRAHLLIGFFLLAAHAARAEPPTPDVIPVRFGPPPARAAAGPGPAGSAGGSGGSAPGGAAPGGAAPRAGKPSSATAGGPGTVPSAPAGGRPAKTRPQAGGAPGAPGKRPAPAVRHPGSRPIRTYAKQPFKGAHPGGQSPPSYSALARPARALPRIPAPATLLGVSRARTGADAADAFAVHLALVRSPAIRTAARGIARTRTARGLEIIRKVAARRTALKAVKQLVRFAQRATKSDGSLSMPAFLFELVRGAARTARGAVKRHALQLQGPRAV